MAYSLTSTYPALGGLLRKISHLRASLLQPRKEIRGHLGRSAWKFSLEKTPTAQAQTYMSLFY
jgi:hypothetical protein